MNHDCHGDVFTRFGKRWARCFADSYIFEFREGMEFCPNCKRQWAGAEHTDWKPDESSGVLRVIDLPHYQFLAEEREKKIKKLEADLELWKQMYKDKAGITAF